MNNLYIGTEVPKNIYFGISKIKKVYFGNDVVWMNIPWETYMYDAGYGFFLNEGSKNIVHETEAGKVERRCIVFPCSSNQRITVSKNIQTTMRIGFLQTRSSTSLISNATQTTGTSINSIAPSGATYCVVQMATNGDLRDEGSSSTGIYTWNEVMAVLNIKIQRLQC